jgi:phosphatidylserine/phosphatidylglycerophosphate/cardiolipin synthase-like enzyme
MPNNRKWAISAVTLIVLIALVAWIWRWENQRSKGTQAAASQPVVHVHPAGSEDGIYVFFSPSGRATDAVVDQIKQARSVLHIQAYMFTSTPIATAVVDACQRGVQIIVVLDPSQEGERYHGAQFLYNHGIPVYIDHKHEHEHGIAHNKVMLIDNRTIITGSFNFTNAAESANAENLLILLDKPDLYAAYERNFQTHLRHSDKYQGRPTAPAEQPAPSRSQRSGHTNRQPAPVR